MGAIALRFPGSVSLSSLLLNQTVEACGIAKEAAAIAAEGIATGSLMVLNSLREQERTLDRLDVTINDGVADAITRVDEREFHELLVCMKFTLGLERIAALLLTVGDATGLAGPFDPQDTRDLVRMATVLERMLSRLSLALSSRKPALEVEVLKSIAEMDRLQIALFGRHSDNLQQASPQIVFMGQSLQRTGDYAKHLAGIVCQFVSGTTVQADSTTQEEPVKQVFLDWLQCRETTIRRSAGRFTTRRAAHIRMRPFQGGKTASCR